ncbi:MAG: hypothetical protein JXQ73_25405 [Phycisphaerae bacterium]|nr:hypothetical protein [Phycisphaerae bacterium]
MAAHEDLELLNAALALAMVDGDFSSAEKGIIQGLAARAGVGQVSLQAMMDRAQRDPDMHKDLHIRSGGKARKIMEFLVAQARIDGEITNEERDMLVKICLQLGIDTDEFGQIYAQGVAKADELRKRRRPS